TPDRSRQDQSCVRHSFAFTLQHAGGENGARTIVAPTSAPVSSSGRQPLWRAVSLSWCEQAVCCRAAVQSPARISPPSRSRSRRAVRAGCFRRVGRGAENSSVFGKSPRHQAENGPTYSLLLGALSALRKWRSTRILQRVRDAA